jgi:hypothetical protein
MRYNLHTPCDACPFLRGTFFTTRQLKEFASGEFPCHKQADLDANGNFVEKDHNMTNHCAGALIYLEKRQQPHQMMRIAERLGLYDYRQLDMQAPVR